MVKLHGMNGAWSSRRSWENGLTIMIIPENGHFADVNWPAIAEHCVTSQATKKRAIPMWSRRKSQVMLTICLFCSWLSRWSVFGYYTPKTLNLQPPKRLLQGCNDLLASRNLRHVTSSQKTNKSFDIAFSMIYPLAAAWRVYCTILYPSFSHQPTSGKKGHQPSSIINNWLNLQFLLLKSLSFQGSSQALLCPLGFGLDVASHLTSIFGGIPSIYIYI